MPPDRPCSTRSFIDVSLNILNSDKPQVSEANLPLCYTFCVLGHIGVISEMSWICLDYPELEDVP